LLDTLYSQCDKNIQADLLEILKNYSEFNKNFNSDIYIKENANHFFIDPQEFVDQYKDTISTFIRTSMEYAQKVLLQKKYIFFIYNDNDRYQKIYNKHYEFVFNSLDKSLEEEQIALNSFITTNIKELQEKELH
jgi:hypothetical protein